MFVPIGALIDKIKEREYGTNENSGTNGKISVKIFPFVLLFSFVSYSLFALQKTLNLM
jgi:hypothetical protein